MRSKLFVPGVRPELFAKALAGDADALSFDLEDSVPEARKGEARESVSALLQSAPLLATAKIVVVRVNAVDTVHLAADLAAVARTGVDLINLPKVESAQDVLAAVALLEKAEAANGVAQPIGLLANIETPRGLRLAAEIASAHPRVAGLQLGLADLFQPLGIDRRDPANVHAALYAMRMAAAEAGVFAWDAAFADIGDADGFRAEAGMARRLGYVGKSCIHPSQVALANQAFQPDAEEIAAARRIVAAAREAGHGAFLVDGRMIDLPFLKRAEAILASADANTGAS
ncbi:HpcH/HpaI aldolase/citrate lyase family protein [Pseudoxanthomonas sacheonensis]|uniref:HpcH/HpaI aldolase/citrate lyase family protein n=1 Tax=Pseudoxanthomonas sacheonensis TaxID=443615 RepID=UPI0013D52C75|nr:CoA ester lyase [Pseudoxanthomonas sacheonensis]KAF1708382.1 CoA ester lyase [Pseudoxanthomonas sacheonensis]